METAFTFAGFDFPRRIPQLLSRCKLSGSWSGRRFKVDTAYYASPTPITVEKPNTGWGFYHASDFAPGLRWTWCDEVDGSRIRHNGWYTDEYGDSDTIRGVVFRLPHGRGFLAGHAMGEGMSASMEAGIYSDEIEAARAANRLAEICAENEREYQAEQDALLDAEGNDSEEHF